MSGLFKDRFNYKSLSKLALEIQAVYSSFPVESFLNTTLDATWDSLEFKQRVMRISRNLGQYLPTDYSTAIHIIDQVIINHNIYLDGFALFFPGFVELYGQAPEYWEISMAALVRYTQYASAEFAVRAFIIRDEKRTLAQMALWTQDNNEHIRRLASEGCRPRLPWGQRLVSMQQDPTPILGILEQLKTDPSPYVRNSVANNLNDISKTHPELVVKIARDWYGKHKYTDWIVKHGCRTLLKQGNQVLLSILGFGETNCIQVSEFILNTPKLSIGEDLVFSFELKVKKTAKVRLEYGIDYVKANGKRNRKIFQISEFTFKDDGKKFYTKTHSFVDTSTRKHYSGIHSITLIVNGAERDTLNFEVLATK